jgi:hypothetical protein
LWESSWLKGRAPTDIRSTSTKVSLGGKRNSAAADLHNHNWTRGLWRMNSSEGDYRVDYSVGQIAECSVNKHAGFYLLAMDLRWSVHGPRYLLVFVPPIPHARAYVRCGNPPTHQPLSSPSHRNRPTWPAGGGQAALQPGGRSCFACKCAFSRAKKQAISPARHCVAYVPAARSPFG